MSKESATKSSMDSSVHTGYMTEDQLADYLTRMDGNVSKPEVEYMYLSRRRQSLDMKTSSDRMTGVTQHAQTMMLSANNCFNPYPFKVVILGDESISGKQEIFHLFTLLDIIKKNSSALDFTQLPPCDIQTQILQFKDTETNSTKNYALELFLPQCEQEYDSLRSLFFPAADVFIVIFSIKSYGSLMEAKSRYLPEARRFIDEHSKLGDIPIVLVGNHTEIRDDREYRGELVDSQDAVEVAQEFQVSKYIEVFSENLFHVQEIFQQTVHAINAFHANTSIRDEERKRYNAYEDNYFRGLLTVPTPEGEFDQFEKTFEINTLEGVDYFYTFDDEDPNKLSKRYSSAIKIQRPFPRLIKVIAIERCKFASDISRFEIPLESNEPTCYFDPITKGFHIHSEANTAYFLTIDGSKPNSSSMIYSDPGLFFDDLPNYCFGDNPKVPQTIRVVAVEQNRFKSKCITFKPFEILSPPVVHYSENMLRIDTIPGIVYKYTLDGSLPNFNSLTYSRPIMLSRTSDMRAIKVAAFPKLYFSSKYVEIPIPQSTSPVKSQTPQPTIRMTKAVLQRIQHSANSTNHKTAQALTSPKKKASPPRSTRSKSIPPQAKKPLVVPPKETTKPPPRKVVNKDASPPAEKYMRDTTTNTNTLEEVQPAKGCRCTCKAEGTKVEFIFEKHVLVNRMIIKTPGDRNGPEGYEVFMIEEPSGKMVKIGSGPLEDEPTEQIIFMHESFLKQNKKVKKIVCVFATPKGQTAFKILDMKVDYRVA